MFQFTHPVWGATGEFLLEYLEVVVSIHAPRVGCDSAELRQYIGDVMFQFTHPVWGATWHRTLYMQDKMFQFTHPVWGATGCGGYGGVELLVSIHAPRVGCDGWGRLIQIVSPPVSIHAPRVGCDTKLFSNVLSQIMFQFTHPVWGAT